MSTLDVRDMQVADNGIELRVRAAGDGPTIVLCHGFPQTSTAWSH